MLYYLMHLHYTEDSIVRKVCILIRGAILERTILKVL